MKHIQILRHVAEMARKRYRSFGDYSVTELISPPRVVRLRKRYGHIVEPDVGSQIGSIIGTGVHEFFNEMLRLYSVIDPCYLLERSVMDVFKVDQEKRLVTGRFDVLYDEKHMFDIKTTNVWKLIFDPNMKEWHEQQNLYAYLLHRRGIDVESINIVAVYKDWRAANALRDKAYPQDQVQEYQLSLWPWQQSEDFLYDKLHTHIQCEKLKDEALPACTPEERWDRLLSGRMREYAVMKNRKAGRALRVLETFEEAAAYANRSKAVTTDSFIEVRHGVRKRCEQYCEVKDYCNHYIDYLAKKKHKKLNDIIPIKEVRG